MKKIAAFFLGSTLVFGISSASEVATPSQANTNVSVSASRVSIPTGVFFSGSDFIKVESSWVRICTGGQSAEYDIRNAEMDPYGNYALVLSNGASITIYSNGRSLYYNGTTYSKK